MREIAEGGIEVVPGGIVVLGWFGAAGSRLAPFPGVVERGGNPAMMETTA